MGVGPSKQRAWKMIQVLSLPIKWNLSLSLSLSLYLPLSDAIQIPMACTFNIHRCININPLRLFFWTWMESNFFLEFKGNKEEKKGREMERERKRERETERRRSKYWISLKLILNDASVARLIITVDDVGRTLVERVFTSGRITAALPRFTMDAGRTISAGSTSPSSITRAKCSSFTSSSWKSVVFFSISLSLSLSLSLSVFFFISFSYYFFFVMWSFSHPSSSRFLIVSIIYGPISSNYYRFWRARVTSTWSFALASSISRFSWPSWHLKNISKCRDLRLAEIHTRLPFSLQLAFFSTSVSFPFPSLFCFDFVDSNNQISRIDYEPLSEWWKEKRLIDFLIWQFTLIWHRWMIFPAQSMIPSSTIHRFGPLSFELHQSSILSRHQSIIHVWRSKSSVVIRPWITNALDCPCPYFSHINT